jgi:hypothetical protein
MFGLWAGCVLRVLMCLFGTFLNVFVSLILELENRLLSRFDVASQKRELSTMAECAKILSQVGGYHVLVMLSDSVLCFQIVCQAFPLNCGNLSSTLF